MKPSVERVIEEERAALDPRPRAQPVKRCVHIAGRPARIMVAEDDPEMRSMIVLTLRSQGYEVIAAASAFDLLEELGLLLFHGEALPVDLIVSDERMPGILGLELLEGLRKAEWPTPFILVTAFGDPETHERAFHLGASAVFDKPFDLEDLLDCTVEILTGKPAPPPHRPTSTPSAGPSEGFERHP